MAVNQKRRKEKLARRKAKQKEKAKARRRAFQRKPNIQAVVERASRCPLHECLAAKGIREAGLGYVAITRVVGEDQFVSVVFLVDTFCLGVKDLFVQRCSKREYREMVAKLSDVDRLGPIAPECARQLVEGAVAYAHNLTFRPAPEYRFAQAIFGDIDQTACTTEFVYGKDGKPLYVTGPGESPSRAKSIVATLKEVCGKEGFNYMMGGPMADFEEFGDDELDDIEEAVGEEE